MSPLRGYISSYPPRVRQYNNALITPVLTPNTAAAPPPRTKRGTAAINYAEDGFDDDDFEESDGGVVQHSTRRPTGLRSLRREESLDKTMTPTTPFGAGGKIGQEAHEPVEVQGIFRDWMFKRMVRPLYVMLFYVLCFFFFFFLADFQTVVPINYKFKLNFP